MVVVLESGRDGSRVENREVEEFRVRSGRVLCKTSMSLVAIDGVSVEEASGW